MLIHKSSEGVTALDGMQLKSKIYSGSLKKLLPVTAASRIEQCNDSNRVYILMAAPATDKYHLKVIYEGKQIGESPLSMLANDINNMVNHDKSKFKGVGTALVELTCRLAMLAGHKNVQFYAVNAVKFHFKMGGRFKRDGKNLKIKQMINDNDKGLDHMFGTMIIDFTAKPSGTDSPKLMQQMLEDEIRSLDLAD